MREVITSVRQAKTAEDLSHIEQFFIVIDWNRNDVILASDYPVTPANRDEFCRRWEELWIGQLMPSLAAIRSDFNVLIDSQIGSVFTLLELACLICGDSGLSADRRKEMFHFQDGAEEDRE
jgi:hypothetical protein